MKRRSRTWRAAYDGHCDACETPIRLGDMVMFDFRRRLTVHADCENPRGAGDPGGLPE